MNFPAQVPNPAIRRLSLYLRQLEALKGDRVVMVSSREFAQLLGLTDAQVRKDLAYFGQFGRPGVGYEVMPLIHHLRSIFGTDHISPILLVGAGNLGKAATAYQSFRTKGFELVAVFDNDLEMIGQRIAHLPVQSMADLPLVASQHDVHLAIVAVPAAVAQNVADQLIAAGVRGILNFAPTRLNMPPGVTVRNIDVIAELEQLNFQTNMGLPWSARGFTPPESSDLVTKTTECIPQEAVVQVI
jgi:redox-sensing transcriptional repressor